MTGMRREICSRDRINGARAREVLRFLCIGGAATLMDLAVFRLCLHFLPERETICFVIGFALSVLCRFYADKHFTFRERRGTASTQFVLYLASCLLTLLIGVGAFNGFMLFGASAFAGKLLSIPFVTVAGYALFRYLVFRRSARWNAGRF